MWVDHENCHRESTARNSGSNCSELVARLRPLKKLRRPLPLGRRLHALSRCRICGQKCKIGSNYFGPDTVLSHTSSLLSLMNFSETAGLWDEFGVYDGNKALHRTRPRQHGTEQRAEKFRRPTLRIHSKIRCLSLITLRVEVGFGRHGAT